MSLSKEELYRQEFQAINDKQEKEFNNFRKQFAYEHKKFNVGDIIENGDVKIRVDGIKWGVDFSGIPSAVYYGVELKKDNTPKKRGNVEELWDTSLKTKSA